MTPSENLPPVIALLTDFGSEDWYVAAMKGRILNRLPGARIIDISHAAPPQDIDCGAFVLRCALDAMPAGTIFCCVVDPGVGTVRRALVGRIGGYGFCGPDNGLATPLLESAGSNFNLHDIRADAWREPIVSATFHGRDLFAPAAALLAAGADPATAGPAVENPIMLPPCVPDDLGHGLCLRVMLVDHFGNLITNLSRAGWEERLVPGKFRIKAGPLRLERLSTSYGHVREVEALAYWGSCATLEIAVNRGSAAALTGLGVGGQIWVDWL